LFTLVNIKDKWAKPSNLLKAISSRESESIAQKITFTENLAVPCLSLRRPGFDPGPVHMRFVMDKAAPEKVLL
jgi:hypothetical protein